MSSGFLRQFDSVKPADIEWRNDVPFSREFDDIYFNPEDGLAESRYVFLEGNQLPDDWKVTNQSYFTVAELGFGSGLNFLMTADCWRDFIQDQSDNNVRHLHYISIEKRPFRSKDFLRATKHWSEFNEIAAQLYQNYPSLTFGRHRIEFPELKLSLTLFLMPVEDALEDLNEEFSHQPDKNKIDHWFFDGFAPAKNESMWGESICKQVAKISKKGTRLSTFSVAAAVKKPLINAGFTICKRKGYGRKREMLTAVFAPNEDSDHLPKFVNLKYESPWLTIKNSRLMVAKTRVAIIGAGLAGCATAYKLVEKGFNVDLYEKENTIACAASGAAAGIYHPQLTSDMNLNSQFNWLAYLYLLQFINSLEPSRKEGLFLSDGLIRLLPDEKSQHQLLSLAQKLGLSDWIKPEEYFNNKRAVRFPHSAALSIPEYCNTLLSLCDDKLALKVNHTIDSVINHDSKWILNISLNNLDEVTQTEYYDHVILAGGANCKLLDQYLHYPTNMSRGQTVFISHKNLSPNLKEAICEKAYLINRPDKTLHIGTTFENFLNDELDRNSQNDILKNAIALTRELGIEFIGEEEVEAIPLRGTLGYRRHAIDRLPIIGAAINLEKLSSDFANLGQSRLRRENLSYYNLPGLWLNTAYGSHGLVYSLLGSEFLASQIAGQISPIASTLAKVLFPGRYVIQQMKRRSSGAGTI
ncbi:FAD-dependent 5-carboxymethylaminomethyl-2-thiouridine(34) oxidoreductase MnmC [Aliikangiella sp. G2MR2-5]|uniref:FAD-dependent 5-carboxymethylaminomethyl-2-thiouridine(34) oxidoreductase MnmC n=1 Tax=Aliikangiella sp. G2MR2-5 TaxID=2788943 RepID=UPI0018A9E64D|nr:FAD-dependent 5-carboxymethylaminomethyl-2-thiouridine(34) oxidoreductase MnmC [Aliikangiella sp. G2MR2-5]